MRYLCTKEKPIYGEPGQRVEHSGAIEVGEQDNLHGDGVYFAIIECQNCGRRWKEEIEK